MKIKTYGFENKAVEAAYKASADRLLWTEFTYYDRIDSASVESRDNGVFLVVAANKENVGRGVCEFVYPLDELPKETILWYEKGAR